MKILEPTDKTLADLDKNARLTAAQIAKMLGITYPTARRIIEANFETMRIGEGKTSPFFVRAADFAEWLKGKGIEPSSVGAPPARKPRVKRIPTPKEMIAEANADFDAWQKRKAAAAAKKPKRIRRAAQTPAAVEQTEPTKTEPPAEPDELYQKIKQQVKAELESSADFQNAPAFAQSILFENAFAVALKKAKIK